MKLFRNVYSAKQEIDWSKVIPSEKERELVKQFIDRKVKEVEDFYLS